MRVNSLVFATSFGFLLGSPSHAFAQEKWWGIELLGGVVRSDAGLNNLSSDGNPCSATFRECAGDRRDRTWGVRVSRKINDHFSAEVGYLDLGTVAEFRTLSTAGAVATKTTQESSGISFGALGRLPLGSSSFDAFGRLGVLVWRSEAAFARSSTTGTGFQGTLTKKSTGIGPAIGLGLRYRFAGDWHASAQWDRFVSIGKRGYLVGNADGSLETLKTDVDTFSIGIGRQF